MYIANCPFNKIKILSKATIGLEKSFWMIYSVEDPPYRFKRNMWARKIRQWPIVYIGGFLFSLSLHVEVNTRATL